MSDESRPGRRPPARYMSSLPESPAGRRCLCGRTAVANLRDDAVACLRHWRARTALERDRELSRRRWEGWP